MSSKFQPINCDTPYLLPPSVRDWLPEKHLARFVVEIVDPLDLNPLLTRYEDGGKQPYHPAMLLALLFFGYTTGVFSSRKLEQATYDSVAFRFIMSLPTKKHSRSYTKPFSQFFNGVALQWALHIQHLGDHGFIAHFGKVTISQVVVLFQGTQ